MHGLVEVVVAGPANAVEDAAHNGLVGKVLVGEKGESGTVLQGGGLADDGGS